MDGDEKLHLVACKARTSNCDPPQDCDWPFCGCDAYANKVIVSIEESGFEIVLKGTQAAMLSKDKTIDDMEKELFVLRDKVTKLDRAIAEHHAQKADDRCIEDDDRLYAAAGLPPCDRRVGDKAAMLANCARFIDKRCEGGGWPSYAELEAEIERLRAELQRLVRETEAE